MPLTNRQIVLERLPQGRLTPRHFRLVETPVPTPGPGQASLKTLYLSLDAASRAWMQGATYRAALKAGEVMAGGGLAEVADPGDSKLRPGDLVWAETGWQDYVLAPSARLTPLPRVAPLTHLLSVYGIAGLTAYFGLLDCAPPERGETVVVSAAAGSVGSIVGQIARLKGCRVVGIAGGSEKCRWLTGELGFDAAIDYKAGDLGRQLKTAAPGGIDVYFDNVGGEIFETCLFAMNDFGRIACCGAISQYDGEVPSGGPRGVPGLIVTRRLKLTGFIVLDYADRFGEAVRDLQTWVAEGAIKVEEDVIDGLENAPAALVGLLAGENRGKRMIGLSADTPLVQVAATAGKPVLRPASSSGCGQDSAAGP